MDPISHAASGALLALALPQRPQTRLFVPLAALATILPDIDVVFSPAPIDFLLLHRGITHSIFAVPIMAAFLALLFFPLWRKSTPNAWSYLKTCLFISILLLLHIWLDVVTTYGTMAFLPFSDYRVRLNGIFIIDILLTIPMILAIYYGRARKKIISLALVWIFIYPAGCVALRMWHEQQAIERLTSENIIKVAVLPDAFAPLYWRVIYQSNTAYTPESNDNSKNYIPKAMQGYAYPKTQQSVHHQGLDMLGRPRTQVLNYPALRSEIAQSLNSDSRRAKAYLAFSLMPIEAVQGTENEEEFIISDLRFGTMLPFVQSIMQYRNDGAPPFLLKARRKDEQWTGVRLVFSGSGKDSAWQNPQPPEPTSWWQWLVGIY